MPGLDFVGFLAGAGPMLLLFSGVYLAPLVVGYVRDTRAQHVIALVTVMLGWTVVGWVVAMLWAAFGTRAWYPDRDDVRW